MSNNKADREEFDIPMMLTRRYTEDKSFKEGYDLACAHKDKEIAALDAYNKQLVEKFGRLIHVARKLATLAEGHHSKECSYNLPLPTGTGNWHCSCGLDSLVLDGELLEEGEFSKALASQPTEKDG